MKTTTERRNLLRQMEKLEPLDLDKHKTIGSLVVNGMSKCSFGARMLGDVARTLIKWAESKKKAGIIYDGDINSPLYQLLLEGVNKDWFKFIVTSEGFLTLDTKPGRMLVVGIYSDRDASRLYKELDEVIFVNNEGRCKPDQIKDGCFPNVVFADPNIIIPILFAVLGEFLEEEQQTIIETLRGSAKYGAGPKEMMKAVCTWEVMLKDKGCSKFFTASGAMTVAQMSLVICDFIEKYRPKALLSTGALMAHGFIAGLGLFHAKYDPKHSDSLLAEFGMNRVTDTIEPETNFDHIDEVMNEVMRSLDGKEHSPTSLHRTIGEYLSKHPKFGKVRGILRSAYECNVPIVVPAFHDSELGNDHYTHNLLRDKKGIPPLVINQELDTKQLLEIFTGAERLGIISIGGGYPRNHAQNLAPLTEIANARGAAKFPVKKFSYGCRFDPQCPWHGGMGGCTYEENESWRKFLKKAIYAQLRMDATIAWPLVQKAVDELMAMAA